MEEEKIFYSIKEGIKTCEFTKIKVAYLREERNKLLQETDWIFLPDVVIDENKLNIIKQYRQELRDFINRLLNDSQGHRTYTNLKCQHLVMESKK